MIYNDEINQAFVALGKNNAPWVRKSAVCNTSTIGGVITRANNVATGRSFALFQPRRGARLGRRGRRRLAAGSGALASLRRPVQQARNWARWRGPVSSRSWKRSDFAPVQPMVPAPAP